MTKQQWTLKARPQGIPDRSEVDIETRTIDHVPDEHLLIECLYFSMDPAIRGWMSDVPN